MLPNLSDYMQAFQHPNFILSDRELASCQCPQDQQGQPIVQSGGFALTFQLKGASKRWAVRCFHREVKDRDRRYSAISAKLNEPAIKQSGYFVDFAYQATGVTVKGQKYPIVKMSWANGVTLGSFLESNYNSPQKLRNLQDALKRLYKFLVANHIAHGDIQPGNLMVSNDGQNVQLIDYDGMFVSGMESLKAAETGVPNFQHPSRQKESPWNDRLDRFPFIMLDVALSVLEEMPQYWTKTNSSDEKVLFETTDFLAPYGSQTFNELKADVRFAKQISILQQICSSDFDSIPDADSYLQFVPSHSTAKRMQQPQTVTISYKGNYTVLDAINVTAIASHVGDVVEIVGLITNTKEGWTHGRGRRGNRPYMFINFKTWISGVDTFRLVLWSEILDQFAGMGVNSVSGRFTNKYVSVVGMINVFKSPKFGVSYQLVPTAAKQVQIIDKTEFDFRLGRIKKQLKQSFGGTAATPSVDLSAATSRAISNEDKLTKLTKIVEPVPRTSRRQPPVRPAPIHPHRFNRPPLPTSLVSSSRPKSNAEKLMGMQKQWKGVGTSPTTPKPQPVNPTPPKPPGTGGGCCLWLVGIIVVVTLISRMC